MSWIEPKSGAGDQVGVWVEEAVPRLLARQPRDPRRLLPSVATSVFNIKDFGAMAELEKSRRDAGAPGLKP